MTAAERPAAASTTPAGPEALALAVTARRMAMGLSREGVAERGGPSHATVLRVERGEAAGCRRLTLAKFDAAFRWPAGTALRLLDGKQSGEPEPLVDEQLDDAGQGDEGEHLDAGEQPADQGGAVVAAGSSADRPSWSRPPFEPGHTLSIRHGAFSPRRVDPVAEGLVVELLAQPDTAYLSAGSYRPAVWAWARAEAQVRLLDAYLAGMDLDDERAGSAHALLDKAERRASSARGRLGLDPLSRARLGRDVTAARLDLAQVLAAERERAEQDTDAPLAGRHGGAARPAGEGGDTGRPV